HPDFQNHETREACERLGIVVETHAPMGHNREPLSDPEMARIAAEHGRSPAQVILRWHVQLGDVSIPKSASPERMRENLDVFDFTLSAQVMETIAALDRGADCRVSQGPATHEGCYRGAAMRAVSTRHLHLRTVPGSDREGRGSRCKQRSRSARVLWERCSPCGRSPGRGASPRTR